MSTFPIEWHRKRLLALRSHLATQERNLKSLKDAVDGLCKEVEFRQLQITKALLLGKGTFDGERFLKPCKRRNTQREQVQP